MGIDYSYEIGYGLVVMMGKESKSGKFAELMSEEFNDIDDQKVYAYLDEHYDHIGYSICGDFMSGDTYHFFYLKDSHTRVSEIYMAATLTEFENVFIDSEKMVELVRLGQDFKIPEDASFGWKLINTVS